MHQNLCQLRVFGNKETKGSFRGETLLIMILRIKPDSFLLFHAQLRVLLVTPWLVGDIFMSILVCPLSFN